MNRSSSDSLSTSRHKGFNNFIASILPPPPDHRRVVLETEDKGLELPGWLGKANSAQEKFGVPVARRKRKRRFKLRNR